MTYRGRVENGMLILDALVDLPDGAEVEVHLVELTSGAGAKSEEAPTVYEQLEPLIGTLKGLPPDFAENHDHYLYGVRSRGENMHSVS